MIDSLVRLLPAARYDANGLPKQYALVTLHRPSNVDDPCALRSLLKTLLDINSMSSRSYSRCTRVRGAASVERD